MRLLVCRLLVSTLVCAGWSALAAGRVDRELVREVRKLIADPALRPTQASPALSGSFGELAAPYLPALDASWKRTSSLKTKSLMKGGARVRAVLEGKRPTSDLPAIWKAELKSQRPAVLAVLRATHAASARMPKNLRLLHSLDVHPANLMGFEQALRLGALEVRRQIEQRHGGAGLALCADLLAVVRDLSHGYLVTRMIGVARLSMLTSVCFDAERVSSDENRKRFSQRLAVIESAFAPLADTFEKEEIFGELLFFGGPDAATLRALPRDVRPLIRRARSLDLSRERDANPKARWDYVRAMDAFIRVVDEPPGEADPAIQRAELALKGLGDDAHWLRFIRILREDRTRLSLLLATTAVDVYHREHGRWPSTLVAALPDHAELLRDARTGRPLQLHVTAKSASIVAAADPSRHAAKLMLDLDELGSE